MSTSHRDPALTGDHTVPILPVGRMTEDEFLAWADEETRAEWVDGEVVVMSPSNFPHGRVAGWLAGLLEAFVGARRLGAVAVDAGVRFAGMRRRRAPDLLFLAHDRLHLAAAGHVEGPPDLIVEIVSPDSAQRDWTEKFVEYEAAGVREYWVIDPAARRFEAYALTPTDDDAPSRYRRIEERDGRVASVVLPGFNLTVAWLWPETQPPLHEAIEQAAKP